MALPCIFASTLSNFSAAFFLSKRAIHTPFTTLQSFNQQIWRTPYLPRKGLHFHLQPAFSAPFILFLIECTPTNMPTSTACLCLPRKGFPIHTPLFCYFSFILLLNMLSNHFANKCDLFALAPAKSRALNTSTNQPTNMANAIFAPALRGFPIHTPYFCKHFI